jgi:MFS family permease
LNPEEKRILTVTCFGHFMSHCNMLVFPALLVPLASGLGMKLGAVMELSFWMYLLFGVTALPWGLVTDRLGARPLMMLFFLGAGLCAVGAAFSLDDPHRLSLYLAGVGLFSGIYHPAGLGLVARGVERLSLGMAYNGMFGNLGLAAAPLMAGLVNWISGPQAAYLVLAGLNLAGLVMFFLMRVDEPERPADKASRSTAGLWGTFVILLGAMMLGGFTYRGATITVPAYFELKTPAIMDWLGGLGAGGLSSNLVATLLTSFIFVVGAVGQYSGGRLGERIDPRWGYLLYHAIALPAVVAMAFLANLPLVLAALVYLFFLLGMQPMENTLVARLSPPAFKHSAFGAKFVLTFGIGSVAVLVAGLTQEAWGMDKVFLILGLVSAMLVAAIGVLIWRTGPQSGAGAPARPEGSAGAR